MNRLLKYSKLLGLLLGILAFVVFAQCDRGSEPGVPKFINFPAEGGTVVLEGHFNGIGYVGLIEEEEDEDGVTWSVMKVDWLTIKTSHVSGKTNNVLIAAPNKSGKKRELVIDYGDGPHDDGRLKVTQFP